MLTEAGIDTDLFKGHSVRTAAASAAHKAGASIKDILKAGNWRRESTFRKFYYKSPQPSGFALAVLNGICVMITLNNTLIMYAVLSRSRIESPTRVY